MRSMMSVPPPTFIAPQYAFEDLKIGNQAVKKDLEWITVLFLVIGMRQF